VGISGEDAALRASEVVLGECRDLFKEPGARLVSATEFAAAAVTVTESCACTPTTMAPLAPAVPVSAFCQ